MKRTCKQCGKEFEISPSEIQFYKKRKLNLPRRCKECREQNKSGQKPEFCSETESGARYAAADSIAENGSVTNRSDRRAGSGMRNSSGESGCGSRRNGSGGPGSGSRRNSSGEPGSGSRRNSGAGSVSGSMRNSGGRAGSSTDSSRSGKSRGKNIAGLIVLVLLLIVGAATGWDKFSTSQDAAGNFSEKPLEFRSSQLLEEHYEKHGIEMGFASAEDYEAAAEKVVLNDRALHKEEKEDGDDVYYLESTNELVIVSTDGYIRTYFEPEDGLEYFKRQ